MNLSPQHSNNDALAVLIRQTVLETLNGLGFATDAPSSLQADMYYLRRMRTGSEDLSRHVRNAALSVLVSSALFVLWQALKLALK
jgi:hypothetical protein